MITTRTGRVVYQRRTHMFRYRDVNRIVRVVKPSGPEEVPDIIFTIQRGFQDLAIAGASLAELARGFAKIPYPSPGEVALTIFAFFLGFIADFGEELISRIRVEGLALIGQFLAVLGGPFFESETGPKEITNGQVTE